MHFFLGALRVYNLQVPIMSSCFVVFGGGTKDQYSPLGAIGHVAYQTEDNIKYNEMTLFTPNFFFHILGKVCTL